MTEEYSLLPLDETSNGKTGFAKNRRHEGDPIVKLGYSGGTITMTKSSVLGVLLVMSIIANMAFVGFLVWNKFPRVEQNPDDDAKPQHVTESMNGKTTTLPTTVESLTATSTTSPGQYPTVTEKIYVQSQPCNDSIGRSLKPPDYVNIFHDLNAVEIKAVNQYLMGINEFSLVKVPINLRSNFIFSIELHVPNKSDALNFLDKGGQQPVREAKVVLFLPSQNPPVVMEYVVAPVSRPSYHYVNPRRNKPIPYRNRQFSPVEMSHAVRVVQTSIGAKVEDFLQRNTEARFFNCESRCLTFTSAAISSSFSEERKLWINAMYKVEFTTINAVGFQFLLNLAGLELSDWHVEKVWYAGQLYKSFDELVQKYERGETPKLNLKFPSPPEGRDTLAGTLHNHGRQFPDVPMAGPRQYEPQGHRYTVHNQHIEYLQQWAFTYRMSYAGAIHLHDVRFGGERIAHEISLQEISVLYAGANPSIMYSQLTDSAFGLSRSAHGLVPGVDCPDHATFLPVTLFGADHPSVADYPNSICVFEHNCNVPARRHKGSSFRSGFFYSGLVDNVLIVRTIYVMYNYDYILDFIFHQSGALEIKVYSTGYILSAFYTDEEKPFGFKVFDHTVGSIHHHMFNFKVDLDILGTENRYETLNFVIDNTTRSWYDDRKPFPQLAFRRFLKETEKQAAYKMNFDTPKYHVFYNDKEENKFGEKRGYRLLGKGFTKQILPETAGALNSYTWSRYQMAVTKFKDTEEVSSSMHAIFDSADPVVSLQRYIDDDEDIVDQDLVAWVTLGMLHIPHTEDIPNTPTTGTDASIVLLPYNYFQECPSMGARDSIRIDAHPTFQVHRHGMPTDFSCVPKHMSEKQIQEEKTNIFMSLG